MWITFNATMKFKELRILISIKFINEYVMHKDVSCVVNNKVTVGTESIVLLHLIEEFY